MRYERLAKRIKTKWVKALRSGKYNQARGILHAYESDGGGYCCLGVLAHCLGVADDELLEHGSLFDLPCFNSPLNADVEDLLIMKNDGSADWGKEDQPISFERPEAPQSFKKIATWIERCL